MYKGKKIRFIALFSLVAAFLTACGPGVSEKEYIAEVFAVADVVYGQYVNDEVVIGQIVYGSENDLYHYAAMIDEDKVLIATDDKFQSGNGYVVSYDMDEMKNLLAVPESMHYDGDCISIKPIEGYDNLYAYSAGL